MKGFLILIFLTSFKVYSKGGLKHHPLRELSVILGQEGYYPKKISVFVDEKVRFFLTSSLEESSCLIIESPKLFLSASKGKISEGEVIFEEPGEYGFHCPNVKEAGKIVVLPKKRPHRDIASEKGPSKKVIWMPRDY